MLKPGKRPSFNPTLPKNVSLIVAASELKGRSEEGHYNNNIAPRNLPNAADTAQETRVTRLENLHQIQRRRPGSPAVFWAHFLGIFYEHTPCEPHS